MKEDKSKQKMEAKLMWVAMAQTASSEWREESWRDCEMYDGGTTMLSDTELAKFTAASIDMLPVNRTFPVINLILGLHANNRSNIIAKGRTHLDSEIGQTMSEAIAFIMDQNDGAYKIGEAFRSQCIPGIGMISVCENKDPRKEKIAIRTKDWKSFYWDPFSDPWLEPDRCKYVFEWPWMDLEYLIALFPDKEKEIRDYYDDLTGEKSLPSYQYSSDYASQVEERVETISGSDWVNAKRKRVRPVQMFYTHYTQALFALSPDGKAIEINQDMPMEQQYQMIKQSTELVTATVHKIRATTFIGELELQDMDSPYNHDMYPYIPWVGYIDRWGQPFGIPRQIRPQNIEIIKRRSMMLAALRAKRVTVEKRCAAGNNDDLQKIYDEANKLDGFIVLENGTSDGINILDQDRLINGQTAVLQQTEMEIKEISGANSEMMAYESNVISDVALQNKQKAGQQMMATMFVNNRRSLALMGYQIINLVQNKWKGEKILRITDRITGHDRFVQLNQKVQGPNGQIFIKNDITQGKFDLIISETPQIDTVREQNLNLITEWVKKSPPEIIPILMNVAFELADLPNKEILLAKIKPLLGVSPEEENMSPDQIKQKVMQELEAQKQEAAKQQQIAEQGIQLNMQNLQMQNEKMQAETQKLQAQVQELLARLELEKMKFTEDTKTRKGRLELAGFKEGAKVAIDKEKLRVQAMKPVQKSGNA